ncbi:hypothetical protein NHG97_02345 [Pseudomonas corrugata]|uniref:hypothetical protein n=1 Tax=Pseudomonas corrugata TaxID=47879 RepID=UPI0028C3FBD4|nr:hypothetical protein [Pseudomonas corrugata]MDU9037528.1 hypothetical protein [Pseudomonas corrugata]
MDYSVLLPFMAGILLLFCIGYILGGRGDYRGNLNLWDARKVSYQRVSRLVQLLLILGVMSSLFQVYLFARSGGGFSLSSIGENYVAGYQGYERGQAKVDLMYIVNILDQALSLFLILICTYYFFSMKKLSRFAFIFIVATYLFVNVIGSGKQKYLGDIIIFTFFCTVINFAARRVRLRVQMLFLGGIFVTIVFFMFIEILRQRYLAAGITLSNIHEKAHVLISWNEDSEIFNWISPDYGLAVGIFVGYFTNGLYGLYLSLTLPFEWTYFVGNSYSLGRIVEIVASDNSLVLEHTYPYRVGIEYGWGLDKWHSLFAWLASDISFLGVLMLTPVFAFLYARLWLQAVQASNPFAGPLFIYFSLGLVFSYANNQIMHGLAGVIVLFLLIIGWGLSGHRLRLGDESGGLL